MMVDTFESMIAADMTRMIQHDLCDADHRPRCSTCMESAAIVTLEDAYWLIGAE